MDRIEALAGKLGLPRAALDGLDQVPFPPAPVAASPSVPFADPDPHRELRYPSVLAAKLGMADYLGFALAKLAAKDRAHIDALLRDTLDRRTVIACVRATSATATARGKARQGRKAAMRAEVVEYYGLARSPRAVGYYETAHHRQLLQDVKQAVYEGDLVALCGVVGAGKTVTLRRLQEVLTNEGRVLVSRSMAVERNRATLGTLITALFCDLSTDKGPKAPTQIELRERALRHVVRKRKKPVVLIVDEAHDLHHSTLTGLKRLIEMVADGGGTLSVLLAGWPRLRNDLRSPTMEEIGYRTTVFSLEGVTGSQREYIEWVLGTCADDRAKVDGILDPAAVDLLASRLRTPLQIEQHLTLALETGYQASERPVGEAIVDSVLSKQIDDLEPTLMRHGDTVKVLCELLGTKPAEVRALFRQTLEPDRARELKEQLLAAGLPV